VALVYGTGLILADLLQPAPAILLGVALGVALAAIFLPRARGWLLWPLILLTGWTNLVCQNAIVSPWDLRSIQGEDPAIVTLRGELVETPDRRHYILNQKERERSLAEVEVDSLRRQGRGWQPASGRVLVATPGMLPADFHAERRFEVSGVLSPPPGPQAEGLFDYRAYLRRQGIHYQLKTDSIEEWRELSPPGPRPISERFLDWAQRTLALGLPVEDESLHLLWAMTLGWKTGITNEVYDPFMKSGTLHIFAISGLHIALITGILVALLRALRVSRGWCGFMVAPLIWFYTGVTGWQPSAVRSTIMMTVIIGGWSLRRPSNLLNSLAAAAFMILLWDPRQLFGASFQLSFCVVLSMALLLPKFEGAWLPWTQPDELLPAQLVPRWKRLWFTVKRWGLASLATSLAAWLGSLPLTALYFHMVTPVTLLVNVVVVPLSSAALACNLGSLVCGAWCPWLAGLFNHSAWWWMECMKTLSQWATLPPLAYFYVSSPQGIDLFLYYGLGIAVLCGWIYPPKHRTRALVIVLSLASFYTLRWGLDRNTTTITVLPAGGGTAIYSRAPALGTEVLLDSGSSNAVRFVVGPYLRARGVDYLEHLALTHGDARHVGGAEGTAALFSPRQICVSAAKTRSPAYRRAVDQFRREPERFRLISRGDQLGAWTVLHPAREDSFSRADDNALVVRGEFDGIRVLLLSDLGPLGQEALLKREADPRADIVVAGLPSMGEPLGDELLQAIRPKLILVADSEVPASEKAGPRLTGRLARSRIPVLYTRQWGATTITINRKGWKAASMNGLRVEEASVSRLLVTAENATREADIAEPPGESD
jgi:ComEC/Rec2-related protein